MFEIAPYLAIFVALVLTALALWPGMTAGGVDWNTAWLWPVLQLSAQVRSLALIGVAGAIGGAFRELRRRMNALDSLESHRAATMAAVEIALSGMFAIVGWLVIRGVLIDTTNNPTGLIGANPFGVVALAVVAGYFGPELVKRLSDQRFQVTRKQDTPLDWIPPVAKPEPVSPKPAPVVSRGSTEIREIRETTDSITMTRTLRTQWEDHPDDPDLARRLATALLAAGQVDEAVHVFDALIDANPDDEALVREKAALYRSVGDERRYIETVTVAQEIAAKHTFRDNVGKTITLSAVEIHDLPFFANFTWQLQPNVNVLLGRNGYGKSHLLRAIVGMLQNDRGVTGQFFSSRPPRGAKPLLRVDVVKESVTESCVRTRLLFEKQFGVVPLLAIPDMRYIEKSGEAFAPTSGALDLSRQGASHFLEERSYQGLILTFLYELSREFNPQERFDRPIFRLIQDVVQELTDRSFKFVDVEPLDSAGYRILVATDGNESNPLPLQKASQGTLSVLSMVGLVYRFLKSVHRDVPEDVLLQQQGIVVIDEIDAHLHPTWQQQVLQLFRDKFPNVQFIITAHTPLVVAGCKKREVAVLTKDAGGFTVDVREEHFIGASPELLYKKVFEVERKDLTYLRLATLQPRAPEFKKRVEELESQTTLTEAESAELEALHEKLYYLDEADHIDTEQKQAATQTRERQRMEMELKNKEGKVHELESQVSALKQELDAQSSGSDGNPPS